MLVDDGADDGAGADGGGSAGRLAAWLRGMAPIFSQSEVDAADAPLASIAAGTAFVDLGLQEIRAIEAELSGSAAEAESAVYDEAVMEFIVRRAEAADRGAIVGTPAADGCAAADVFLLSDAASVDEAGAELSLRGSPAGGPRGPLPVAVVR